jgi:malate dehydrogenase (oxaloacetate-decarboxylating)(NADP+)
MPLEGEADLKADALLFHSSPRPGKLEIVATKPLANQRDLALAYSPGVAFPCEAIAADPHSAAIYTARQNLVAVLSNGTAVLGLGAIGPLAAKPVMEGKAVLFKKFAGIDVFDIEVAELNVDKLVDVIVALEPTFGGSISRTSRVPNVSRSRRRQRPAWAFPCSTTISTERRSLFPRHRQRAWLTGKADRRGQDRLLRRCAAALASLNLLVSLGASRITSSSATSRGSYARAATR